MAIYTTLEEITVEGLLYAIGEEVELSDEQAAELEGKVEKIKEEPEED